MTLECDACRTFRKSAKIGRTRVEIVHAMFDGSIYETVHSLLINHACLWVIWPTHTTITKDRDFVATFMIDTVGHITDWLGARTSGVDVFDHSRACTTRAAIQCRSRTYHSSSSSHTLQKLTSVNVLFHNIHI